jgi:RHS repeat-associated protein
MLGASEYSTGKERDAETGLDYFGARYLSSAQGRFTSPDPVQIKTNRLLNPQRLNLYSYAVNNPLRNIDPDGRDAIAVVFPEYRISALGTKWSHLGHAGIVTIDSKGRTRYFDYGRYPQRNKNAPPGIVREFDPVDVKMNKNGTPTAASLKALLQDVSRIAGQGGKAEFAYFDTTDDQTNNMNKHARDLKAQNESMDKEAYDLTDNSCGTFVDDMIKAGGVNTPWLFDPRPNSMIGEWQGIGNQRVYEEYQIYLKKVEEDLKRQK